MVKISRLKTVQDHFNITKEKWKNFMWNVYKANTFGIVDDRGYYFIPENKLHLINDVFKEFFEDNINEGDNKIVCVTKLLDEMNLTAVFSKDEGGYIVSTNENRKMKIRL